MGGFRCLEMGRDFVAVIYFVFIALLQLVLFGSDLLPFYQMNSSVYALQVPILLLINLIQAHSKPLCFAKSATTDHSLGLH